MVERAGSTDRERSAQGDRRGRRLLRRAGGQGLPRPEEPAHVAHHLPRACERRPFDHFPKVWNDIKPYWLGRGRLRPDQERSDARSTPRPTRRRQLIATTTETAPRARRPAPVRRTDRRSVTRCRMDVASRFQLSLPVRRRLRVPGAVGVRAGGDLRHDGRHQPRAWRVHHVRRLCHGLRRAGRAAAAARHPARRAGRRARRHGRRAAGDPAALRPAGRHHRRDLGHQPDRHARHADRARLDACRAIGTPFGSVTVGAYSYSVYRLVLFAAAVVRPRRALPRSSTGPASGSLARATIQLPHMAGPSGSTPGRSTP